MSDAITKDYVDTHSVSDNNTSEANVSQSPHIPIPTHIPSYQLTGPGTTVAPVPVPQSVPGYQQVPGYQYSFQYDPAQQSFDPWVSLPAIIGLDELCDLLGVDEEPALPVAHRGPILTSVSGKRYTLVNILHAQMDFMARLNMLLIHRQIVPESK